MKLALFYWALGRPGLHAREKLTLLIMAGLADAKDRVDALPSEIAATGGMGTPSVYQALRVLTVKGLITADDRLGRRSVFQILRSAPP